METLNFESQRHATPLCHIFGECGGCHYQNIPYSEELRIKERGLLDTLRRFIEFDSMIVQPIVPSPKEYNYRHRIDLRLLKTKDKRILVGFSPDDRFGIIEIDQCPIAAMSISNFIPRIKDEAKKILPEKYRLANLVVRCGQEGKVQWGGIGKGSLELDEENYLWAEIHGKKIFYSLDTFFQANLSILPDLFKRIREFKLWNEDTVLFDLYGGVGLFSLGLLGSYSKSYLIEDCKNSIKLARYNVQYHQLSHVHIVEGRVEDCLDGILKEEQGPTVAIIDPPRAGLTPQACEQLAGAEKFKNLLYLSCSPESLGRDLKYFVNNGWDIETIIPFDFFPKTKHLETLVWLKRSDRKTL